MRIIFLPLLALAAVLPVASAAAQNERPNDVVVTGRRLADTERALKACIARKCATDEDVAATLAHAENQFVAGDYRSARTTLLQSLSRNGGQARAFPVEVSNLRRASATTAAHLGLGDSYRAETFETLKALRAGLGDDDKRVLDARLEVGAMLARFDEVEGAASIYKDVAARARALKLPDTEGFARLRLATLYSGLSLNDPGNYLELANNTADALANNPDPQLAKFARAAVTLKARTAIRRGNPQAVDALIANSRLDPTDVPVLIYAPVVDLQGLFPRSSSGVAPSQAAINYEDQWIDIAFYVLPDGRVSDADVVRRSPRLTRDVWVQPVLSSVANRRYAPLKRDPRDPGLLRVERYSLTSRYAPSTRSRIPTRDLVPQLEVLDLSIDSGTVAAK